MSNDNSAFSDIWGKMNEERKLEQTEREIRYASRRSEKLAVRRRVEESALKLCGVIDAALEKEHSADDLAALAAALCSTTTAMQVAENYAESMPLHVYDGFCACAV